MITLALLSSWHPSRNDVSPLDLYKPITRGPTKTLQTLKGVRLLGAKKLRFIKIATFGCTYPLWIFNRFEPPKTKAWKICQTAPCFTSVLPQLKSKRSILWPIKLSRHFNRPKWMRGGRCLNAEPWFDLLLFIQMYLDFPHKFQSSTTVKHDLRFASPQIRSLLFFGAAPKSISL